MARVVIYDGVRHEFPDDFSDADVGKALAGYQSPTGAPVDQTGTVPRRSRPPVDVPSEVLSMLPVAGSIAGGVMGGAGGTIAGVGIGGAPGAIAGAGAGGAGGEALRQILMRSIGRPAPQSAGQALGQIGTQAAVGAGSEAVGLPAGRLMGAMAKPLMGAALRTSDRAAIEGALDANIRPGRSILGKGTGLEQINQQSGKLAARRTPMIANAVGGGIEMPADEVLKPLEAYVASIEQRAQRAPALKPAAKQLRADFNEFAKANKGTIPADAAQQLKEDYADLARAGYKTDASGQSIPLSSHELRFNKIIADKTRGWLADNVGVGDINAEMASLKRLKPKMAKAEGTQPPALTSGPAGLLNVANPAAYARAFPAVSGQAALIMNNPLLREGILHYLGPRALGYVAFDPTAADTTGR